MGFFLERTTSLNKNRQFAVNPRRDYSMIKDTEGEKVQTTQRAVAILVSVLLMLPSSAFSQGRSTNDWLALQRLTSGDKLRVELKQGNTAEGRLISSTDTTLSIEVGKVTRDIKQTDVKRIYLVLGKSAGKTVLKGTAIGAGTGAVLGAGLGEDCSKSSGVCLSRGGLAILGAALFAIPGAIIGLILGASKNNHQLIYEA
jgi:hypothetical protein